MNSLLVALNQWSEGILDFAWPMLWQSSLLIAVILGLDLVLRRRLRAGVRYALWLVVLIKLLVPPSVALPTAISWWVRPDPGATEVVTRRARTMKVTYGPATSALVPESTVPTSSASLPEFSPSFLVVSGSVAVSLILLAWMLVRWRQLARRIRETTPPPSWLGSLFEEIRTNAGLSAPVQLRVTPCAMSPAVCGLLRPTVLMPRKLIEELSPAQLHPILLHELEHVRRWDVWVNCCQTLLQIAYWWHPLLWLANARMRRLREQAVDDAVMLGLGRDCEVYAPTLLQVARLALRRPMSTLGLVGILESPGSLRQRIERLLDFRPPRRAGLSLVSLCCILGFAALAVPMGPAPQKVLASPKTASQVSANMSSMVNLPVPEQKLAAASGRAAQSNTEALETRMFKVDPRTFTENIRTAVGGSAGNTNDMLSDLKEFFSSVGLDLAPPKTIWYADQRGELLVRATPGELEVLEELTKELGTAPPQLHVRVMLVELPVKLAKEFWGGLTNGGTRVSILTQAQARSAIKALENKEGEGVKLISDANVTTLSGRQTQIQWVEEMAVPTNAPANDAASAAQSWVANKVPVGSTVDIFSTVRADGRSIELTSSATITELLGYDDPQTFVPQTDSGVSSPPVRALPLPRFRILQVPLASAIVWDGQTIVLSQTNDVPKVIGSTAPATSLAQSELMQKDFILLITPTIVDPAGNRVHAGEETPAASPKGTERR